MSDTQPIVVARASYRWEWSPATDRFSVLDRHGLLVLSARLQPAVILSTGSTSAGAVGSADFDGDELTVRYENVNGGDLLTLRVRLAEDGIWFDAPRYESARHADVVSVLSFAEWSADGPVPGMECDYIVHPGSSESSALGPVVPSQLRLDVTTWLGRGSNDCDDIVAAQWGLPVHYVAGFSIEGSMCERGALTRRLSAAFCLGLTAVPAGDLLLRQKNGRMSPWLRTHSDQWRFLTTGSGAIEVGASWALTVADSYDSAIRDYYRALRARGIVRPRTRTAAQRATLARPQFNTWGAQCAAGTAVEHFDQAALESIYEDVRASGMRPGVFVIDDKWEGEYGLLEHDAERFPRFEAFLDRVRDDGMQVGLWAAFLRCDAPAAHGLLPEHMLCDSAGAPVKRGNQGHSYYLFDVSQEPVRAVLADRARAFMSRYRPSLVKFDFGYELPALANAAPRIRSWGGELLLVKALELVIGAMREVDPDVVVMYYNLSPLLADFVDLHSTDDMYLNADEYHAEANRRIFFSSLLGEIGVPSYGSGGYDWLQMQDIWLDTAAFGPIGSLGSFHGDPRDSTPTDLDIARYNGLAALTRPSTEFATEPLTPAYLGGSTGARSSSWARYEGDALTALVTRPTRWDGSGVVRKQRIVRTEARAAILGRTEESLEGSSSLGIVSLDPGPIELLRPHAERVTAMAHSADGGRTELGVEPTPDGYRIELRERAENGSPVEWTEFTVVS
ncbi:hypothetical protein [Leifsonia shinshuensis]|uniref:hypothetical protein n=1 Tax=Leifsonia shinshuensis TaxID=150026 RepID=UPI00285501B3|nr:hypothetical protein [Leifsonia shinshuensis]MDR6972763.1 hypothetical protein [Leifsonia shinshuensis]